jgi:NAD(P)-dependent dehydrogenase (short-subunit alcohol dehydrogenase family)
MSDRPVVLITGASRGIGAATARAYAQAGYDCAMLDLEADELFNVAEEAKSCGAEIETFIGDLSDLGFAQNSVNQCLERWGHIDVLVNNAAWRDIVTMRSIELSSWEQTLRVCLTAPAFLAKWCAVAMEKSGRGVILNVSSIQSRFPAGISPAYVAAKGGLDALTYELATLYGPSGIRVLSVNLGAIDTDLSRGYGTDGIDQQLRNYVEDMIPLGRYGQPEEIGQTLLQLAGPGMSYLTGTTIEIDGGWFHQATPYSFKHQLMPSEYARKSRGEIRE